MCPPGYEILGKEKGRPEAALALFKDLKRRRGFFAVEGLAVKNADHAFLDF